MITLENRFFLLRNVVCFFVEGGIIVASVLASFFIMERFTPQGAIGFDQAVLRGGVVAFFCQACMYLLDLYDLKQSRSCGEIFFSLIFAVGVVCIGIGLVSYVAPRFSVEGNMYYLTILFVTILLFVWRMAFDLYLTNWAPRTNLIVVGTGTSAQLMAEEIRKRNRNGFNFVGFVGNPTPGWSGPEEVIGTYKEMNAIVQRHKIRKVVSAMNERRGESPVQEFLALKVAGVPVIEWQSFFEQLAGRIPIDNLPPSYFIYSEGFRKSAVVLLMRRVISILVSILMIVLLSPIFLLTMGAILLDSPGPVFYTQRRVGLNGKVFRIFKFRSMKRDAEASGAPIWAQQDDPRITRVGKVIRLLRIDELPQVFNVLKGDLDLVGPRPERPEFVEKLKVMVPYFDLRHTVRPGLTGWAQIMFSYSGSIEESKEKLQYDLFYIKNMSLKLDLYILFSTVKIVLLGRGAR